MKSSLNWMIAVAGLLVALASIAQGQTASVGAISISGGSGIGVTNGSNPGSMAGYRFLTTEPVQVSELGLHGFNEVVLSVDRTVTLWNDSGSLLTSVTVPAGTVREDGFFYAELPTPISLPANQFFRVAALYLGSNSPGLQAQVENIETAPGIIYISPAFDLNDGIIFPQFTVADNGQGLFGGSFRILKPDTDGDGTADLEDECPNNPERTTEGACGCIESGPNGCFVRVPGMTISSGTGVGVIAGSNGSTAGWRFEVTEDQLITDLGLRGRNEAILSLDRTVAIWNEAQEVVAQAVVPAGSVREDGFFYVNLDPPVTLSAGQIYRVGAFYETSNDPGLEGSLQNIQTPPGITYLGTALRLNGGFGFPNNSNAVNPGIVGGTFKVGASDADQDGTADFNDECPTNPDLAVAGECGCDSNTIDGVSGCFGPVDGVEFTGGQGVGVTDGTELGSVAGWRFQATQNVPVTHLGLLALTENVLSQNRLVTIWRENQTVEVAATVPAGSVAEDGFFYVELPEPFVLQAGQTYRIAALYVGSNDPGVRRNMATFETPPGINFLSVAFDLDDGFVFPQFTSGPGITGPGFLGPTMRVFQPDGDLDGVANLVDNCVDSPNADQLDDDGDGFGDGCDCSPIPGVLDVCPRVSCTEGTCELSTGTCTYPPLENACSDGFACTRDVCNEGTQTCESTFAPELAADINGSGNVSITDVQCGLVSLLAVLSEDPLPPCYTQDPLDLDLTCDGSVTIGDVQVLINKALDQQLSLSIDADLDGCIDACGVKGGCTPEITACGGEDICNPGTCEAQVPSTLSCSELGWGPGLGTAEVCGESDSGLGGCNSGATFAEAEAICRNGGVRLCTIEEMLGNETRNSGCGFDSQRVWTSSECAPGSRSTSAGSTVNLGTIPEACTPETELLAVRCCSDAVPALTDGVCVLDSLCDDAPSIVPGVDDAIGFTEVLSLQIPTNANFDADSDIPYQTDKREALSELPFDRVAYYMELTSAADGEEPTWVWVSMDTFTDNINEVGVPIDWDFQQPVASVTVESNSASVADVSNAEGGNIEFWSDCYSRGPDNAFNSDDPINDNAEDCYGSMQVHLNGDTLFAFNRWSSGASGIDVGIGTNPSGEPDWTFETNANGFAVRTIRVFVQ